MSPEVRAGVAWGRAELPGVPASANVSLASLPCLSRPPPGCPRPQSLCKIARIALQLSRACRLTSDCGEVAASSASRCPSRHVRGAQYRFSDRPRAARGTGGGAFSDRRAVSRDVGEGTAAAPGSLQQQASSARAWTRVRRRRRGRRGPAGRPAGYFATRRAAVQ